MTECKWASGCNPVVVCQRQELIAEIERLETELAQANAALRVGNVTRLPHRTHPDTEGDPAA